MSACAFEQRVWQAGEDPSESALLGAVTVEPDPYQRAAPAEWAVAQWLKSQVLPRIGALQAGVVDANCAAVCGYPGWRP